MVSAKILQTRLQTLQVRQCTPKLDTIPAKGESKESLLLDGTKEHNCAAALLPNAQMMIACVSSPWRDDRGRDGKAPSLTLSPTVGVVLTVGHIMHSREMLCVSTLLQTRNHNTYVVGSYCAGMQ